MEHDGEERSGGERPRGGIFVHPGQIAVSDAAEDFCTVLGSCVAVCLRDSSGRAAGMAHYVLPSGSARGPARLRYANHAVPELIEQVRKLAPGSGLLQAKLVGGAAVLSTLTGARRELGMKNVEAAREHLARAGVEILAELVGGELGRRVVFQSSDGSVFVRELRGAGGGR